MGTKLDEIFVRYELVVHVCTKIAAIVAFESPRTNIRSVETFKDSVHPSSIARYADS